MFRRFSFCNNRRGSPRNVRALLICVNLLFSANGGHAEDVDELQTIMAKAHRECSPDYRPHNYLDYRECDIISDVTLGAKCANEVARKNSIIWKWNSFVRNCHASQDQVGSLPPAPSLPARTGSEPTSSESVVEPDSEEVVALIQRARKLAETGDIAAARLVLRRAAEARSAQAALALGGMYDPAVLKQLGIRGVVPDIAQARSWYETAREYGSQEAPRRLEALVGEKP
jgi:hypothetical protein